MEDRLHSVLLLSLHHFDEDIDCQDGVCICCVMRNRLRVRDASRPQRNSGLLDKRRQVREYEMSNEQLHREIERKQERILRLKNDPQEQEIEIRQRLKFAGPGEKIYIIDDKKK